MVFGACSEVQVLLVYGVGTPRIMLGPHTYKQFGGMQGGWLVTMVMGERLTLAVEEILVDI